MNLKILLFGCLVILVIGYLLGMYIPYIGPYEFSNRPISKGEYYGNIINIFAALGTCLAVIVALFMNEIRSLFKRVIYSITLDSPEAIEEVEDVKGTKKAKRYHNSIQIYNDGNINALNCELYLESAKFTSASSIVTLNVENSPIKWNKIDNSIIHIPYKGKKVLHLFEIIAPQKQSTPNGSTDETSAQITILGLNNIGIIPGKWDLSYCLYSTSSKPQKFKYIVEWTGQWEERQTEMKNFLTMKLEKE